MSRDKVPDRRHSWTQHVKIERQSYYLTFGEYVDGRLAELWIVGPGTEEAFTRGVLGGLARLSSIALQCGASVDEIAGSLRSLNFPPNGPVELSAAVRSCTSVLDWVGQEMAACYGSRDSGAEASAPEDDMSGFRTPTPQRAGEHSSGSGY
jgi:hypothetical protein